MARPLEPAGYSPGVSSEATYVTRDILVDTFSMEVGRERPVDLPPRSHTAMLAAATLQILGWLNTNDHTVVKDSMELVEQMRDHERHADLQGYAECPWATRPHPFLVEVVDVKFKVLQHGRKYRLPEIFDMPDPDRPAWRVIELVDSPPPAG